ncbi:FtsW/RodA/SpoVE family cell cycle protein [Paenilisteria weihenstephanensis]|uniref:Probable peptidoglycan glycosyltransferase FtsW n=1 Tax=Listeria weihenstephanensis TaxID=1006155 RepID=A0A1S7FRD3_9LIST|nr:FtsW/RodA/SpoVE family cell cycle protein [Listeria weihenstephanensis]AQY49937.1 cell division protein FtsW [Listeria weihenstephanensis]
MLTKQNHLILLAYIATGIWSCLMVYSASYAAASNRYAVSSQHFAIRQAIFYAIGLGCLFFFAKLKTVPFCSKKTMKLAGGIAVLLLILVLLTGTATNNAQRWIQLGGATLQPTELVKILLIIVTGNFSVHYFKNMAQSNRVTYLLIGFILFCAGLIILQPDLGTSFIVLSIFAAQLLTSGLSARRLSQIAITGILFATLSLGITYLLHPKFFSQARLGRFAFLDPFSEANLDASYQLRNGYYAIADGGIFGKGFGQSVQKLGFLPESHTDFISAVISEELGIIGILVTLTLILFFIWKALHIALRSHSAFDTSICIGFATWIAVQAILNLGGVSGMIPLTGVPLPFISFGGTSIITLSCGVGFLISAERQITLTERRNIHANQQ